MLCPREHRLCALSRLFVPEVWLSLPSSSHLQDPGAGGVGSGRCEGTHVQHVLLPGCSVTAVGVCGRLGQEVTTKWMSKDEDMLMRLL